MATMNLLKKEADDSVLKTVATWTIAGGVIYLSARTLVHFTKADVQELQHEKEVTKANVGNWAAEKAQRLQVAIEAGFYGGNTDEDTIFRILFSEVGTREPWAAIVASYKLLTRGRDLYADLEANLDPWVTRYMGQTPDWDRAKARIQRIKSRSNTEFVKK